jgi:hypothetical protein
MIKRKEWRKTDKKERKERQRRNEIERYKERRQKK